MDRETLEADPATNLNMTGAALELMLGLEQRLRMASLRIAIEGDSVSADVVDALRKLAAFVDDKLN